MFTACVLALHGAKAVRCSIGYKIRVQDSSPLQVKVFVVFEKIKKKKKKTTFILQSQSNKLIISDSKQHVKKTEY